jgi:hypothetical protein
VKSHGVVPEVKQIREGGKDVSIGEDEWNKQKWTKWVFVKEEASRQVTACVGSSSRMHEYSLFPGESLQAIQFLFLTDLSTSW